MAALVPSESELRERLTAHLAARPDSPEVVIAWSGYLAALTEWGVIDHQMHSRLSNILPKGIGNEEIAEIMLGPDYKEIQRQLSEEADQR